MKEFQHGTITKETRCGLLWKKNNMETGNLIAIGYEKGWNMNNNENAESCDEYYIKVMVQWIRIEVFFSTNWVWDPKRKLRKNLEFTSYCLKCRTAKQLIPITSMNFQNYSATERLYKTCIYTFSLQITNSFSTLSFYSQRHYPKLHLML